MDLFPSTTSTPGPVIDPQAQSAALAESRSRATREALAEAESAAAGRRENLERARAAFEQAIGANTRISIERRADSNFVYRAIDVDSGEVVREWPPAEFASFVEAALSQEAPPPGLVLNERS